MGSEKTQIAFVTSNRECVVYFTTIFKTIIIII